MRFSIIAVSERTPVTIEHEDGWCGSGLARILSNVSRIFILLLLLLKRAAADGELGRCEAHCTRPCDELNGDVTDECDGCIGPEHACRPGAPGYYMNSYSEVEPASDHEQHCAFTDVDVPPLQAVSTEQAIRLVQQDGLVQLPGVLPDGLADTLRTQLMEHIRTHPDNFYNKDGCIGELMNCRYRYDVPLTLDAVPALPRAIGSIARSLTPLLSALVGGDGRLVEFSAYLNCRGAPTQDFHSDSPRGSRGGTRRRLYSVYVALQATDHGYGATRTVRGSHLHPDYDDLGDLEAERTLQAAVAEERPAALPRGAALLFDSRLTHRAGENVRGGRLMLLLSAIHARGDGPSLRGPVYSLHDSLRTPGGMMDDGLIEVRNLAAWAAGSNVSSTEMVTPDGGPENEPPACDVQEPAGELEK